MFKKFLLVSALTLATLIPAVLPQTADAQYWGGRRWGGGINRSYYGGWGWRGYNQPYYGGWYGRSYYPGYYYPSYYYPSYGYGYYYY